ncbi:MAG TPA: hypothetical protein VGM19_11105 [Armatimonadota bacterium]|jgi:hypothetical protein
MGQNLKQRERRGGLLGAGRDLGLRTFSGGRIVLPHEVEEIVVLADHAGQLPAQRRVLDPNARRQVAGHAVQLRKAVVMTGGRREQRGRQAGDAEAVNRRLRRERQLMQVRRRPGQTGHEQERGGGLRRLGEGQGGASAELLGPRGFFG